MSRGLGRLFSTGLMVSAVTAAVAVVRSKVVAVVLGPEGMGITAEVTTLAQNMLVPAMACAGPAFVAAAARGTRPDADPGARADAQGAYDTAWTATLLLGVAGVAAGAVVARLAYPWGAGGWWWVAVLGAGLVVIQGSTVTGRLLTAAQRLRPFSVGSAVTTVLQVLAITAGTVLLGLPGFFLGSLVGAVAAAPVWQLLARRATTGLRVLPVPRLDPAHLRETARLGAASLVGTGTTLVTLNVLRTAIAWWAEPGANGLFQACWAVDAQIVTAVLAMLGSFLFPRYAAARDRTELARELETLGGFLMRVAPPFLLAAIAVRGLVLVVLYTPEFLPASGLLGLMLAGDVAKIASWTQGNVLLYRGHARIFGILQIVNSTVFTGAALAGLWAGGLVGIGWGYFLAYVLNIAMTGIALHRAEGITSPPRTIAVALGGSLLALACNAAVGAWWWGPAIPLLAAAVWAIAAGAPQAVVGLLRRRGRE